MTNTPGRTAAEKICKRVCGCQGQNHESCIEFVAGELMEYAKQEVAKAQAVSRQLHDNREDVWKSHIDLVASESRKKALTEAAGVARKRECSIAGGSETCNCADDIAEEIEALRGK